MIRRWLFGMPGGSRPMAGGAVQRAAPWYDRWPAWLVALLFLLRFVGTLAAVVGVLLAIDTYLLRPWKYVALAALLALPIWGYLHELVKRDRALRPGVVRR